MVISIPLQSDLTFIIDEGHLDVFASVTVEMHYKSGVLTEHPAEWLNMILHSWEWSWDAFEII